MPSTPLPPELWEKIVEHLPPPPPRLVPCIAIYKYKAGDEWCCVNFSGAIHSEEVRTMTMNVMGDGILSKHKREFNMRSHQLDSVVNNAFMYGFNFVSEFDRKSYENHGRTFRLIRKPI